MKIGIFQDIHANLPAFEKAIEVFNAEACAKIYHVGDLIGIGPYPKEVVELAIAIPELGLIMGNHDYWFAFGLPQPQPKWMSDEEVEHQNWNHKQIGDNYRAVVQQWKFIEELKINDTKNVSFLHYGYDEKTNWFKGIIKKPTSENLDMLFNEIESDIVFYGHNHMPSDLSGKSRYVNLGSAGCHNKPEVRIGIMETNTLNLEKLSIPYDDNGLMEAFEVRKVPARAFITNTFITRTL